MADYTQPDHVEKRLRYFDGQFLVVDDFVDEQKYHIDRQRRQTRLLRTSGILEGLQVTQAESAAESVSVEVAPGTAIDLKGRAIILSEKYIVDLTEHIGTTVTLAIAYVEEASDPPTSDRGSKALTRWHEQVAFEVVKDKEVSTLDSAIGIVKIIIDANRNIRINANHTYANFHSGVRFGNTTFGNSEISLKPVTRDRLQLTGNLTVSGSLTANSLTATQDIVAQRALNFPLATRPNNNQQEINFGGGEYGIGIQENTQYFRTAQNFAWYQSGSHDNTSLNPGDSGRLQMILDLAGRLGIGNSSPQAELDVNGTIKGDFVDVSDSISCHSLGVIFYAQRPEAGNYGIPKPLASFGREDRPNSEKSSLTYDFFSPVAADIFVLGYGRAEVDENFRIFSSRLMFQSRHFDRGRNTRIGNDEFIPSLFNGFPRVFFLAAYWSVGANSSTRIEMRHRANWNEQTLPQNAVAEVREASLFILKFPRNKEPEG